MASGVHGTAHIGLCDIKRRSKLQNIRKLINYDLPITLRTIHFLFTRYRTVTVIVKNPVLFNQAFY
jgi:hypothetical protein